METADLIDALQRLAVALAIGFLVGIERGWKQRDDKDGERVAGLRTHALAGLFGGLTGLTLPLAGPLFLAAVSIGFSALFILFQYRDAVESGTKSVTAALAGLMVYALGVYAALGDLTVAAAVGVAMTAILAFKQNLHRWLASLSWPELRSALLLLAATFIALPILPDRTIDPWGAVNPRSLWFMTILLAGAMFGGYVALKVLGPKAGMLAGAVVGAIVSSTAVTLDLARRAKSGEAPRDAAAAAMLATVVSLTRVGIIGSAFSASIALHLWIPLGAAILVSLGFAVTIALVDRNTTNESGERKVRNPLDVVEVGKFALLLAVLTVAAKLSAVWFGDAGLSVFAATAGLVDVDAVTLAVGGMRDLSPTSAAFAILIAAAANTLFKGGLAVATGGRVFGLWFAGACAAALAAGAIAFAASATWLGEPGAATAGLP